MLHIANPDPEVSETAATKRMAAGQAWRCSASTQLATPPRACTSRAKADDNTAVSERNLNRISAQSFQYSPDGSSCTSATRRPLLRPTPRCLTRHTCAYRYYKVAVPLKSTGISSLAPYCWRSTGQAATKIRILPPRSPADTCSSCEQTLGYVRMLHQCIYHGS